MYPGNGVHPPRSGCVFGRTHTHTHKHKHQESKVEGKAAIHVLAARIVLLYIHFYYVNHDCVLIIVYTHQESKVKGKAAIDVLAARIGKSGGALVQQMIVIIFGDP